MKQTKGQRILALLEKGHSASFISNKVGCTKRYVHMIRSQRKQAAVAALALIKNQVNSQPVTRWQRLKNFFKGLV